MDIEHHISGQAAMIMTNIYQSNHKKVEAVATMVRQASKTQLEVATTASADELIIKDMAPDSDLSYDHWISVILVSGKALRMEFRSHFTSKAARQLASRPLKKSLEDTSIEIAHDFVREFCNLTAGAIKRCLIELQKDEGDVQIGLPQQVPSYDTVNLKREAEVSPYFDYWSLTCGDSSIVCAARIEILDWKLIDNIEGLELSSILVSSDGDIQFL